MTRRNRYSTAVFADIYPVLDALIEAGGGFVQCGTEKAAYKWRHRAYQARSALVRQLQLQNELVPGYAPETKYDEVVLTLAGTRVRLGFMEAIRDLVDLDGRPLKIANKRKPERLQDMEEERVDFVKNLIGDADA